jgi:hypothetical protein
MNFNGDCSAQDMARELKLVSLEPSENEDSEFGIKIILSSANETATQNVRQHHFLQPAPNSRRRGDKRGGNARSKSHPPLPPRFPFLSEPWQWRVQIS